MVAATAVFAEGCSDSDVGSVVATGGTANFVVTNLHNERVHLYVDGALREVIGLGPGFSAGKDVHMVIETDRGHNLGRIITTGSAAPNTGIPGSIGGHDVKRVLRAPVRGVFTATHSIGDPVKSGDVIGSIENVAISAEINGTLRGLIRSGTLVTAGLKLGDIDPRGMRDFCYTISDKAREWCWRD